MADVKKVHIFGGGNGNNWSGVVRMSGDAKVRTVKTKKEEVQVVDLRFANSPDFDEKTAALFFETTLWGEGAVKLFSKLKKGDPISITSSTLKDVRVYERNNGETGISLVLKDARITFLSKKDTSSSGSKAARPSKDEAIERDPDDDAGDGDEGLDDLADL
jgi:single-stranded DNA-binding protein